MTKSMKLFGVLALVFALAGAGLLASTDSSAAKKQDGLGFAIGAAGF